MTTKDTAGLARRTTLVRAIGYDGTQMPTPEIRALARNDLLIQDETLSFEVTMARRFATLTDTEPGFAACSPVVLAQTVWTPSVPAAIVAWGAANWDVFSPAITRGIPRVDMAKISKLAWPDHKCADPMALAMRLGLPANPTDASQDAAHRLAYYVAAVAGLFGIVITLLDDSMVALAASLDAGHGPATPIAALGDLCGDPRIEALVRLSALPVPVPPGVIPEPWDDKRGWFTMAGEDLAWLADADPETGCVETYARDMARVELDRRTARDADLLQPRRLLRRLPQD